MIAFTPMLQLSHSWESWEMLSHLKNKYFMLGGLMDYEHRQLLHGYRELVPTILQQKS